MFKYASLLQRSYDIPFCFILKNVLLSSQLISVYTILCIYETVENFLLHFSFVELVEFPFDYTLFNI